MDIHSLHVEHSVSLALYTILTFANSWHYKGTRGVNWFCGYSLFVFLGAVAVALRGHIPSAASIVLGTICVSIGYVCLLLGVQGFFDRKNTHPYIQVFLVLAMAVCMIKYGAVTPDTTRRLILFSLILCIQQLHLTLLLLSNRNPSLKIPANCMAVMVFGLVLGNLARVVGVFFHGAPHDYLDAGPFLTWVLIANSSLQGGIMIAYVWMTAAMLRGKLEVQASTDPLTGALNRRGIEVAAEHRIVTCRKDHLPLSAMVIDLNNFKHVNDTYGHHCGDATLIAIASCIQRGIRPRDLLARIGGDEFAVILPNTAHIEALEIAERLRSAITQTDIIYGLIRTRVSASFGTAELQDDDENWEKLFLHCDKLLYKEKHAEHLDRVISLSAAELEAH